MAEKELVTEGKAAELRIKFFQKYIGLTEEESKDLVEVLTEPTPKDWIKERPARGGAMVQYIPGSYFIRKFNDAFGFLWSYEAPDHFENNGQIVVKGRWSLQIPGRTMFTRYPDGREETLRFDGFQIVKEQFGSSEIKRYAKDVSDGHGGIRYQKGDVIDLGDDYKGAATDAMKKCGTQLGMFADIYRPREIGEEATPSDVQLGAFYLRAERAGKDKEEAEKWAEGQLGKLLEKASQQEILGLTADLIKMGKERK